MNTTFSHRAKHLTILVLLMTSILKIDLSSQTVDFCGRFPYHQASSTNSDSIWFDRFGNSYDFVDEVVDDPENRVLQTCGYFEITYHAVDVDFQNRICEVFLYLSSIIEQRVNVSICGDTIYPESVNIRIAEDSLEQGVLGIATPVLMNRWERIDCAETYTNLVYNRINGSSRDSPGNDVVDGRIVFTNSPDINWYTGTGNTPDGYYDLFSVLLHEAGHLFAFNSLIDTSGPSNGITLWDQFLYLTPEYLPLGQTVSTSPLMTSDCEENCWSLNDSLFSDFNEVDSVLNLNCNTSGDLDFVFGAAGLAPIVGGTLEINNLSHLHANCNGEDIDYVMQRTISNDTILNQRREFTDTEIQIFCELGYKTNSCNECYVTGLVEGNNYIENQYYPFVYYGCINDTVIISKSDLLCNDFTNNGDIEITNWHVPNGLHIEVDQDSVKFISSVSLVYTVRYTIKGCECQMVNLTFFLNIGPCFDCSSVDPCENLTCTNGFEQFTPQLRTHTISNELSDGGYWVYENSLSNSVDVCGEINGNKFLNVGGFDTNLEGLCLKLSEPISPGCKMRINLKAAASKIGTAIRIQGSEFPPCNIYDTRVKIPCIPTQCNDYVFNPICIDTIVINNLTSGGSPCPFTANLQPITEMIYSNNDSFDINYIIISPLIDQTSLRLDDIVIQKSCFDPCFSFEYLINCSDLAFTACEQDSQFVHFWDFGDDSTSTEINPLHTYLGKGTFIVTHIVQDLCGISDTSFRAIEVSEEIGNCCPDTLISQTTTWNSTTVPNNGKFHSITVKGGQALIIEDDVVLEFCEDGALIIEPGAYVDLAGELTAVEGMTWKGVYVSGDTSQNQLFAINEGYNGYKQGFIEAREGSSIKNASIGIRNYGYSGPDYAGGIIRCTGTLFLNNTIGVEFERYQNFLPDFTPFPSIGQFMECDFISDTNYYLNEPFYAFARLFKADGMQFVGSSFTNLLIPELPSSLENFGFGIHAVSAGFGVYVLSSNITDRPCSDPCIEYRRSTFNGLGHGIYVMTLDKNRPYSVYNADFNNCFRGLTSVSTTGGTIVHNNFNLGQVPDKDFSFGQIGAEFHFDHNGFVLQENKFEVTEEETEVISFGILCNNLGAFDNEIRRDSFINLLTSNQSFGENADSSDLFPRGLVYLCNKNESTVPYGYDFHIPNTPDHDLIHPFQTPGSSNGAIVATGNQFAYSASDFINFGDGNPSYWFYPQGFQEEPRDSFMLSISKAFGIQGMCEMEYCAPPCFEDIGLIKEDYYSNIIRHTTANETYLSAIQQNLHPKIEQSRSKAIYHRRAASRNAYDIVTHLMIDTINFSTDSLIKWIGYIDTYGGDLQIAGEYASQYDYISALTFLETISMRRILSIRNMADLQNVIDIYNILASKNINLLTTQDRFHIRNIAYSNTGQSSGLARAILTLWNEYVPLPYYYDQQINFRQSQDIDSVRLSISANEPFSIFPNPAMGNVTIEWDKDLFQPESISIVNLVGLVMKNLYVISGSSINFEIEDLNEGLYMVVAKSSQGDIIIRKLIVLRT